MAEDEDTGTPGFAVGAITCKNALEEAGTIEYNFGATLAETIKKYGDAVCHYHICRKLAVSMRNKFYTLITAGDEPMSIDAALEEMKNWVPTVSVGRAKKSPSDVAMAALEKMSPEARAAFIQTLKDTI